MKKKSHKSQIPPKIGVKITFFLKIQKYVHLYVNNSLISQNGSKVQKNVSKCHQMSESKICI